MKCFYHNDMDGRCSGSIVAIFEKNRDKKNFFEVDYNKDLPIDTISHNERVYLVDYSFKLDTIWQLEEIMKRTKDIIWVDHHTSSINVEKECDWLKHIKGIRQEGISGAALTYMYLYNQKFEKIPFYIKLVSDYDCWQFKFDPYTTYFKLGIDVFSNDALDGIWLNLFKEVYKDFLIIESILKKGKNIKEYIDQDNKGYLNNFSYESEIDGYKCLVVNKSSNSWIFGNNYEKYPVVITWVFNGKNYIYTLYSGNENVDCSKIAESYGGGGHKGAAGFKSDKLLFKFF